ncbi:hypothetical protein LCGC14_3053210 [marine sediment metagenome]|uniref:Ryanodine receptor Ryr domain-containing protein n=1 Tax=marine sediment metagenome TaxID=412755 RepID=A0A0F8WLJ5_9ZZZZ
MNSTTEIAQVAYEANRAYCQSLGDYNQANWNFCDQWQRDTVINGVRAIERGVVTGPEQSHENWLEHKENEGWQWGIKKNTDRKRGALTHPCMVPFKELPETQKMKDRLFFAIVTTLLGR